MQEFMLFIRKQVDSSTTLSPERHYQFLKSCEHYIGKLRREGKLISAQPFERTGIILSGRENDWLEVPFNETPEVIGGYYHIRANSLDEAIALAKGNPEFEYNENTRIEVRPIKTKEDTTGFVYPGQQAVADR